MKKNAVRICVLMLAVVMLLSVLMPAMTTLAGAVTKSEIQGIKDDLSDVQSQREQLEEKLEQLKDSKEAAQQKVELLQSQILLSEQQIYESQKLLDNYDQQIADKQAEIARLEEQEAQQYEQFYAQTRWMEENGGTSVISVLFQASSFTELLDTLMLITDLMNYNDRIITQLEQTQAQLSQAQTELQTARDDQAAAQTQLENVKADLTRQKTSMDQYYQQLLDSEESYNSEAAELQKEEERIQADLKDAEKKYEEQLAAAQKPSTPNTGGASNPVVDPSGGWYWPVPGHFYISSVFGGRYHPITGKWQEHTGTDIPAPSGTPIYSAKAGVVTTVVPDSGTGTGYGNYCIVYHGNGYATLYAHMKSLPTVSVGQMVSDGQLLGYVGTTGSSTGNHLHFELRIDGNRADALDLYPNLSFSGL